MPSCLARRFSRTLIALCLSILLCGIAPVLAETGGTTTAQTPAATAEAADAAQGALAEQGEAEPVPDPVAYYLVDIVVFARDTVDTSAEHWGGLVWPNTPVYHFFYPDLSNSGNSGTKGLLNYSQRQVDFGIDQALATSQTGTVIDKILPRLKSINAKALIRRQWVFNSFDFAGAPAIRLNDFRVYLPKAPPPSPESVFDPVAAGALEGTVAQTQQQNVLAGGARAQPNQSHPLNIFSDDLSRCEQDTKRRLVLDAFPGMTASSQNAGGQEVFSHEKAKSIFESTPTTTGVQTPAPPVPAAAPASVDDYVQIALTSPGSPPSSRSAPVLEEIDFDSATANRLDGHIKLFLSRQHHAELQLQYLRPFMTTAISAARPDAAERQPCLLAFRMQENRRLKNGNLHYYDHPAFGAILFFIELEPEPDKAAVPEMEDTNGNAH